MCKKIKKQIENALKCMNKGQAIKNATPGMLSQKKKKANPLPHLEWKTALWPNTLRFGYTWN